MCAAATQVNRKNVCKYRVLVPLQRFR